VSGEAQLTRGSEDHRAPNPRHAAQFAQDLLQAIQIAIEHRVLKACFEKLGDADGRRFVLGAYTAMASPDRRREKGQRRCNNKRTQGQGEFTGEAQFQPSVHAVQ
jgi:hypothetical protein